MMERVPNTVPCMWDAGGFTAGPQVTLGGAAASQMAPASFLAWQVLGGPHSQKGHG